METNSLETNDTNTLEDPGTLQGGSGDAKNPEQNPVKSPKKKSGRKIRDLVTKINIYLLLFILIVVVASGIVFVGYQNNRKADEVVAPKTQELTAEALEKLKGSEAKVGDPKQTLSIESNTVFTGKVLLKDSLDVAGTIKVGGALSLPGITVSGVSNFDQIQANNLSIAGDTTVQGQLTIQKELQVTGGATFGGNISAPQITVQTIQLSGDLTFNRHIDAGGGTPGKDDGASLGGGGTASVSGTDTAGTVSINTGNSPGAGCFVTVNFAIAFNSIPHVVVTPVGSGAADLNYYINRSANSFSICTSNTPPAGQSFAFDYIVID